MSDKRWSIPAWLTRWFALTVGVAILALVALSAWFVAQSVGRELDALVLEELHEICAEISDNPTTAEVGGLAQKYALEHPENPLAWRVWDTRNQTIWSEFGSAALLEIAPERFEPLDKTVSPKPGVRWRAEQLAPGLEIGLIVDGAWQLALLRRYSLAVLGIGGAAALLAISSGALLGRRLAGHLKNVAKQVRDVQNPSSKQILHVEGAPEEIREVANALCEMFDNIRREQDRVRLMTSGLAHELRSPIQNLMGEAEVTLLRERTAEEYREVLESQIDELRDLGRVVDNLVILCSPNAARDRVAEHFNLDQEIRFRLSRNRNDAAHAGVQIRLITAGDLELDGDREALLLAINNLIGNAIQWSPANSTVLVALTRRDDEIEIIVEDSGPGVPKSEREKVFEPFYRGPPIPAEKSSTSGQTRGRRRIGYGLGLALAKSAVEAHGGSIEIGASESGGARFTMRIPRQRTS